MRIFVSILLGIVFVSASVSAQNYLYQETFSDGVADNEWFAGFNGDSMVVVNYPGNPSGDGWVGKLNNHISGGNVGASWSGQEDMGNFYYEAQVYLPVDEAVYYGIEFRVQGADLSSGYQFVARFRPGGMVTPRLRFRMRPTSNPAIPTTIQDWTEAEIPGGIPQESAWHKMAVQCKGHDFWFWFDDQPLPGCPIRDYTRLAGAIGAYVWDDASPLMSLYIDDINVTTDPLVSVESGAELPADPVLHANHPNPFTARTAISFDLPRAGWARVAVYSLTGRKMAVLREGMLSAGRHEVTWNAADAPAGVYILRLVSGGTVRERRLVRIR